MTDNKNITMLDDDQAEAVTGGTGLPDIIASGDSKLSGDTKYFCNTCFSALNRLQAEQHKKQGHLVVPFNR